MADSPTDFSDRQVLVISSDEEIKAEEHSEMAVWQTPLHVFSPDAAAQIDQLYVSPA
jgi:hypothetical protein